MTAETFRSPDQGLYSRKTQDSSCHGREVNSSHSLPALSSNSVLKLRLEHFEAKEREIRKSTFLFYD